MKKSFNFKTLKCPATQTAPVYKQPVRAAIGSVICFQPQAAFQRASSDQKPALRAPSAITPTSCGH